MRLRWIRNLGVKALHIETDDGGIANLNEWEIAELRDELMSEEINVQMKKLRSELKRDGQDSVRSVSDYTV